MAFPSVVKSMTLIILILAMVSMPLPLPGQEIPPGTDRWNRAALEWIGLLQNGEFDEAGARVDPAVPEGSLGPPQLEAIWGQLMAQLGTLRSFLPGVVLEQGPYHIVRVPAEFQSQSFILQVTLTDALEVSGFFIQPPEPPPYEPPSYVDQNAFDEEEVTVGSDPWSLPGTLTIPTGEGPFPAVVLVHGSGPNDRDESIGGNRPFKDLAWGLASFGVAVLRYEKRTRVHGPSLPADIGLEEEVIADALLALELVRNRPETSQVFLFGHSLGGMMAPEIGKRDGRLDGIAILAAPVRPFFETLRTQLEYLKGLAANADSPGSRQIDSILSVIAAVERGEAPDDQAVLGAPPAYWKEVAAVDPVETARGLSESLIILQGGRDYQATTEDLEIWARELGDQPSVMTKLYPDLSHLFISGDGMATPAEYATQPGHVAEEVILDLVKWIQRAGAGEGAL